MLFSSYYSQGLRNHSTVLGHHFAVDTKDNQR